MTHTDINTKGWLALLPAGMQPYAVLMRLDRPIGTWLLLLPGWWVILLAAGGITTMNAQDWFIFALFGAGAVIMRGAGCVINDLWDRDLDVMVERTRTRPLASGAVHTQQAAIFLLGLLLLGLLILLQLNIMARLLGFLAMIFVVSYPYMKRITWWPQAFLGLTFNFGALMGWAAMTGTVSLAALLIYIAGFFWTLGYDTVYAHQDREDDMRVGIKSTALRLGAKSRIWVARFYIISWLLLLLAFVMAGAGFISILPLAAAGWHLYGQIKTWLPENPASSLKIFRTNRDFGLLVLLAAALSGLF
jgi:4-hydroxybenzoate polyprenyltransferase